MDVQAWGAVALILVLIIGALRPVNLGALALVAALIVGTGPGNLSLDDVLAGFPVDLFLLLFGVTYLFAVATRNGTINLIVHSITQRFQRVRIVLPIVFLALAFVPCAFGAFSPAAVALAAPIAVRVALDNDLDVRMAGLVVIYGSIVGSLSPLNPVAIFINGTVETAGLESDPARLFLGGGAYALLLAVAAFFAFGGRNLWAHRKDRPVVDEEQLEAILGEASIQESTIERIESVHPATAPARAQSASGAGRDHGQTPGTGGGATPSAGLDHDPTPGSSRDPNPTSGADVKNDGEAGSRGIHLLTLSLLLAIAVGALFFEQDIGLLALLAAVVLNALFPESSGKPLREVGWEIILLVCGLVTLMLTLQQVGTVSAIGEWIGDRGSPVLAAYLVLLLAAVVSAFASTIGAITALIPLSVPLIAAGDFDAIAFVIALSLSAAVVDSSPFSTNGAIVIASTPEGPVRESAYRGLLVWCGAMVLTAPILTLLVFVLPT